MIIALTHMRAPNDQRLAEMAPDIDLILGGHDHDYYGLQVIGALSHCTAKADVKERSNGPRVRNISGKLKSL